MSTPLQAAKDVARALTQDSSSEVVKRVLELLAAAKATGIEEDEVLRTVGDRLGRKQDQYYRLLKADLKSMKQAASKQEKSDRAAASSDGRLRLIDWSLNMTPDQMRVAVARHVERANGAQPVIYKRDVHPVRIIRDDRAIAKIQALDNASFAAEMEKHVVWGRTYEDGRIAYEDCPPQAAAKLRTDTDFKFPVLREVVDTPYHTSNWELVTASGYNAQAGVFCDLAPGFSVPNVPDTPTTGDVERALGLILPVYSEFPFHDGDRDTSGKASLANTLARDITPFVRRAVDIVPMFAIDKNDNGVGATLHADVGAIITTGSTCARDTVKPNDREWAVFFHAHALTGTRNILIDNVPENEVLDASAIANAGTADRLSGRILGQSEIGGGDVVWILQFTGKNLRFSFENARRAIMIRMDALMSDPTEREGFAIADLKAYVRQHRGELVWAYLVLIQNWIARGRPAYSGKLLASFEQWTNAVGGILEAAGVRHFNTNRYLLGGGEREAQQGFLQEWLIAFGSDWVAVGRVERELGDEDKPAENLAQLYWHLDESVYLGVSREAHSISTLGGRLGNKLSPLAGRTFRLTTRRFGGAYRETWDFRVEKTKSSVMQYRLARVDGSKRIECDDPLLEAADQATHGEAVRDAEIADSNLTAEAYAEFVRDGEIEAGSRTEGGGGVAGE